MQKFTSFWNLEKTFTCNNDIIMLIFSLFRRLSVFDFRSVFQWSKCSCKRLVTAGCVPTQLSRRCKILKSPLDCREILKYCTIFHERSLNSAHDGVLHFHWRSRIDLRTRPRCDRGFRASVNITFINHY